MNEKFIEGVNALRTHEAELFNKMEDLLEEENQRAREFEMERQERISQQKKLLEKTQ